MHGSGKFPLIGLFMVMVVLMCGIADAGTCGAFPRVLDPSPGVGVTLTYTAGGTPLPTGDRSYFAATFSGPLNYPDYNISPGYIYPDWCVDAATSVSPGFRNVFAFYPAYNVSYLLTLPIAAPPPTGYPVYWTNFPKVDYILRQKWNWYSLGADYSAIQVSIWNLTNFQPIRDGSGNPIWNTNYHDVYLSQQQWYFVDNITRDANINGATYVPGCGDPVAVIVNLTGWPNSRQQLTAIELIPDGTVNGYKRDTGGIGQGGWTITLIHKTIGTSYSTTTQSDGYFLFTNIPYGEYWLNETPQAGWTQQTANRTIILNGTNMAVPNQTFINRKLLGNVSGYKLNVTNYGLPGWTITLKNISGSPNFSSSTGPDGSFNFTNVPWGTYYLNETPQPGWVQVGSNYTITIDGNDLVFVNKNFTNSRSLCLSGYKLDQNNGPLEGWNITIRNSTNGAIIGSNTTNESGYWQVCGLVEGNYTVNETMKDGWVAVNPSRGWQWGNLTNSNVTNLNFTNRRSLCLSGYKLDQNNGGVPGWNITVSKDGVFIDSALTNAAGYWQVCNLTQGNYTVSEIMQENWVAVSPITQWGNLTNSNVTNLNFTNKRSLCLGGYKLDQNNGALAGWNITVTDGTGAVVGTNVTDSTGYWQVCGLIQGMYNVSEELKTGWTAVIPSTGWQSVTLTDQDNRTVNFTNKRSLCIGGYKLDQNNGALAGWNITVTDGTGAVVGTNTTDSTGYWQVCGLIQGMYNVSEELKTGWTAVIPSTGWQSVTLTDQDNRTVNFTNKRSLCSGNISGMKFNDLNGNGIRDINDNPLSNWTINLYYANNGTFIRSTITNATGQYQFLNLPCGSYRVNETLQSGWNQTAPKGGGYIVEINSTSPNVINRDFGNQQQPIKCGCPTRAYYSYSPASPKKNQLIQFTDQSTGYPVEWNWSFGDGTFSNLKSPQHSYPVAGKYQVTESVKVCGCTGQVYWTSYKKTITVK